MRGIAGILNPGQPFTTLASEVHGLTRMICEGSVMERRAWWCVNDGGVSGKPERYAIVYPRVYVWPIPDRPYRVSIEWDGGPDKPAQLFDCTLEWMDMYETEVVRVREMVQ